MRSEKASRIIECREEDCIYNRSEKCHTPGITVGDRHPECDTFMNSSAEGGYDDVEGMVGACKVSGCRHNSSMECTADGIKIGNHHGHPDCLTFEEK
jgi:hypothetical protein